MTDFTQLQAEVAANIRDLLRWAGFDQKDLAEYLRQQGFAIQPTSLSRRLTGKIPLSVPETSAVASFLGVEDRVLYKTHSDLIAWFRESNWIESVKSRCIAEGAQPPLPFSGEMYALAS